MINDEIFFEIHVFRFLTTTDLSCYNRIRVCWRSLSCLSGPGIIPSFVRLATIVILSMVKVSEKAQVVQRIDRAIENTAYAYALVSSSGEEDD